MLVDNVGRLRTEREHWISDLQKSLQFYARTLFRRSVQGARLAADSENMRRKYRQVMHMFVLKRYFATWKRAYDTFAGYGTGDKENVGGVLRDVQSNGQRELLFQISE